MGSWNGTCALSRLPIKSEDKVLLFLLVKNKSDRNLGSGYASDNPYMPICLPIRGEYNDYGRIEKLNFEESVDEETLLNYINSLISEGRIVHSEPKEYLVENLESFIKEVGSKNFIGVSFMLVLEDLYYDVMAEFSLRKGYEDNSVQERAIISATEYLEEKRNNKNIHFQYDEYIFSRFFYCNKMKFLLRDLDEKGNKELFKGMIELYVFNELLELSRILWTPQAGAGSQYSEYEIHRRIGQYVGYKQMNEKVRYREENIIDYEQYESIGKDTSVVM